MRGFPCAPHLVGGLTATAAATLLVPTGGAIDSRSLGRASATLLRTVGSTPCCAILVRQSLVDQSIPAVHDPSKARGRLLAKVQGVLAWKRRDC
eukprot:scaffold3166_cov399-Prasinococcus_capsulatus_cf.AAC.9